MKMNPVLLKELRSLLRERRGFLVPMIYAAVLSAAVFLFFLSFADQKAEALGSTIAGEVAIIQLVVVAIFSPLVGAAAVAGERERGTWLSLLASPVARWRIATGKAAACALYVLLMLTVSLPVAALSQLFGGADLAVLAGLYATHAIVGVTLALLGLAISTLFHRTWTAALVAVGSALGLIVFTFAIQAAVVGTHAHGAEPAWPLYFNICYSWSLFFGGDIDTGSRIRWLWHFLALASIGAASFALVLRRLRRMCD
jgi:ABC-type transport system involved in multi-copper enzyme maturation permease subunit